MMIITGTSRVKIMVERGNNFEPICSQHPLERYSSKSILMIVNILLPLVASNKIILSKYF